VPSVIVPLRGEAPPDPGVLARLSRCDLVVAAHAGTASATLEAWRLGGARVTTSAAPRGERLREASREAREDVLLFLHADTLLPEGWPALVERAIAGGAVSGAFRLAFAGGGPALRFVAWWANLRTSLTRIPYGDQAPFVRRDVYESVGGHPPWPLLDDYELSRRLKGAGKMTLLPERVLTSPRRYLARGVLRTVLANWSILLRHRLGASPEELARPRGRVL
jgi:rSAM/selenodomain-associated transferase 2